MGIEKLALGLCHQLLRAQHIELGYQAGIQLGFGGIAQPAGAVEALPRHVDKCLLCHDPVVGGRDIHGNLLLGQCLLPVGVGAPQLGARQRAPGDA